jgi:para-nitrobenzyl esterase
MKSTLSLVVHAFAVLICLAVTNNISVAQSQLNVIQTKAGLISGIINTGGNIHIFKGVPFAAPPVGDLRWKAPQPVRPWQGVKKCEAFSASAMQKKPLPFMMWTKEFMAPLEPLSEDCLYLNVWTGAKGATEKRPVIIWIHGGAFTGGSGSVPLYDGETMAKKGVVFVTINYRLGIFGFFAHTDLSKESPYHGSGNYGLLDQVAALQWVKDNIARFGGDPGNVTIAGQSAGSYSVNALVASPLTKGLFQKAIAESGGMFNNNQSTALEDAEKKGADIMKAMKVSNLKAMRALSGDSLLNADQMASPIIDGYFLPDQVVNIFNKGKQNDVPLLTGFNADEGFVFSKPLNAKDFTSHASVQYGNKAEQFLKAFPANTDEEAARSQKDLSRDQMFAWQNITWAKLQTLHGKSKVYCYYFSRIPPGEPNYGAFHSAEFGYTLGTLNKWDRPFTAWDKELSNSMSDYWIQFAATGDPNKTGLPAWPAFSINNPKVMGFGDRIEAIDLPAKPQLEFLDGVAQ